MLPSFKEFDLASYSMRYKNSIVVFKHPDGTLYSRFVMGFRDNGNWVLQNNSVSYEVPHNDLVPLYYYVESGFYHGKDNPRKVYSLMRRLVKSFIVGVGQQYNMRMIECPKMDSILDADYPEVLNPVKPNIEEALKESGALSKRLYLKKNDLYYLSKLVGMRHKRNFVVDPIFKSEIEDCLRGHECSIKL
jgi:hypothetical protein